MWGLEMNWFPSKPTFMAMTMNDLERPPGSKAVGRPGGKALIKKRYRVERGLGRGGVAEVSLAFDLQLERWVAIKRMHVDMGCVAEREKFTIREAKRLARLQHPNIVTVYDLIEHKGDLLLVMEYLAGCTLEDWQEPLAFGEFVEVVRQSLVALSAAHEMGMIHLDLKPTNIMLERTPSGQIITKLLDFGLATLLGQSVPEHDEGEDDVLGSVYNMAPEQLQREPLGVFTDLYSLGCVFYFALTRKEPFDGKTVEEVIDAHLRHDFPPLAALRPDLPANVCSWVERLMALAPLDRPKSAKQALTEFLSKLAASRATDRQSESAGKGHNPIPVLDPAHATALAANIGKKVTVEGRVQRVWENFAGTASFINFVGVSHQSFCLVIATDPMKGDHDELKSLVGTSIRAAGELSDFHGSPQMIVESPEHISRLSGSGE
jgi:serine/threonine protein kinase